MKTNIDELAERIGPLLNKKPLPCSIHLTNRTGSQVVFELKAFESIGDKQYYEGYWHYTEVPDTYVVALSVKAREHDAGQHLNFMWGKDGCVLMNYPSCYRLHGIPDAWFKAFEALIKIFDQAVAI